MTDLLQFIVSIGGKIASVKIVEDWVEVDTVEDLHSLITLERVKKIKNDRTPASTGLSIKTLEIFI